MFIEDFERKLKITACEFRQEYAGDRTADLSLEEWTAVHEKWVHDKAKVEVDNRRLSRNDSDKEEIRARCKAAGVVMKGVQLDLVEGYDKDMQRKDERIAQLERDLSTAQADLKGAMEELAKSGRPAQRRSTGG